METNPPLDDSPREPSLSNVQWGPPEEDTPANYPDAPSENLRSKTSVAEYETTAMTTATTSEARSVAETDTVREGGAKRRLEEISPVGWNLQWINQDMARLDFLEKGTNVSVAGGGAVCCRDGAVSGHGFRLEPNQWYPFECPKWSSWLVLETDSETACVEITSRAVGEFCQTDDTDGNALHGPSLPPHLQTEEAGIHASFSIHNTDDPQSRPTIVLPEWRRAAETIVESRLKNEPENTKKKDDAPCRNIIAVLGAKGVGKSTFVRYLAHCFLSQEQHVYVLDGDTGQAEFGPPGLLTLTCLRRRQPLWSLPHRHMLAGQDTSRNPLAPPDATQDAIFYGGTSSQLDPVRYLRSMAQLVENYRTATHDAGCAPLIVNLDGWVKGLGYQVLSTLLSTHVPRHVVQIVGTSATQQVDVSAIVTAATTVHTIPSYRSQANVPTALSVPPSAWRDLRFVHYWLNEPTFDVRFSQNDLIQDDESLIAQRLASQRPYMVPWAEVSCQDTNGGAISPEKLNGSIVGLCTRRSPEQESIPECVGLGIIRSVDVTKQILYILTPVMPATLPTVNVFVLGNLSLPIECTFLGIKGTSFPFQSVRDINSSIIGADPMRSRNNLLRKGLNA